MKPRRVVLKSSGSWYEEYDVQRIPISSFALLAEQDEGNWQYFTKESDLKDPIYLVYTKKHGRIITKDESVIFNKALLYWEEGERAGNFLYFSKGDTDYNIIRSNAYGKQVRKLIRCIIKAITPALLGSGCENNRVVRAFVSEGDGDGDAGIEEKAAE